MYKRFLFYFSLVNLLTITTASAQLPVSTSHPRIFLDPATKTAMLAKKNTNDADWVKLLANANSYLPGTVIPWDENSASDAQYYGTANIFYSYCGSSWEEAAIALGMAHQLTKTNNAGANATAYSNKMLALADVIIKAYKDYPPNSNGDPNIFQFNSSYATRHMGKTVGIIYDWCYNELGTTRKTQLLNLMKDWFTYMSAEPYRVLQLQDEPTGNYHMGQLICAAYMGYAIGNEDPLSQKMIDFARQRALGTPGSLNPDVQNSGETANNWFTQSVLGGLPSGASKSYLGPKTYLAAPQKDGIPVQGWSYGGETSNFLIDYVFLVKSATGENLLTTDPAMMTFFTKTAEALVHSYTPNRFQYDNSNDNGSFLGCVSSYSLPLRLSAVLEGTTAGSNINYFYKNLLQPVNLLSGNKGYEASTWEKLLYEKPRAQSAFTYKPFYPIPEKNVFSSVPINSGLHKFYMRKDWSPTATWSTIDLGAAVYDQHNHNNAGHIKIIRGDSHDGDDHLLVGANEVAKDGGNGIDGPTNYSFSSSFSNTLFINDYKDYDPAYPDYINMMGGQTSGGYDDPTHEEQNDNFSYFRADLTSAYYVSYDNPDISERSLTYYYRSFIYLRNADVFLVYDKLLAKNSTNALGQYDKHLRWHFLKQPVVNGSNITATMDNSKLFIHTVLPAALDISSVNEKVNPDNTFGSDADYIFNTNTWRAEVRVPGNPLEQDILTVMQPGGLTATEMVTTPFTAQDNMEGSLIKVNGRTELVLFNNSTDKYPVPVVATSYTFNDDINTTHTLCGLLPNQNYQVTYTGSKVTVSKSSSGNFKASSSGVLVFALMANATTAQTITFPPMDPVAYGAADVDPEAVSTNVSIDITYTSSNTAVAVVTNGLLHIVGAGTTEITANQGGNANFTAAVSKKQTLVVTKAALTIAADAKTKVSGTANPELTVKYIGFVNGDTQAKLNTQAQVSTTATLNSAAGDYPITLSGAAAASYSITYVNAILKVTPAAIVPLAQHITFNTIAPAKYGDADVLLTAISTNNTINIVYTSNNTDVATIVNGKLHIVGAGTTTITATQAGNANYIAALKKKQAFTVNKAPLTIKADAKTKISGTANPALTFNYEGFVNNETPGILTTPPQIGTTAVLNSAEGNYPITVSGAVAANYNFTYVNAWLTVTPAPIVKAPQVITFSTPVGAKFGDNDISLNAISTNNTINITYVSDNAAVATIVNGKLHIIGAGTANITASQPGNANFIAAQDVIKAFNVAKASQEIAFNSLANRTYGNASVTISATGGPSGNAVTYTSSNLAVATINGNTITIVGAGNTTINAAQAGNNNYLAAPVVGQQLSVNKAPLTISAVAKTKVSGTVNPELTASYTGFVNNETTSVLNTPAVLSTTATVTSPGGTYPIVVTGATSANYQISFENSLLTVTNAVINAPLEVNAKGVQNFLSTNADGVNDIWIIKNITGYPNSIVQVHSREGKLLFKMKGYDNTWDGKINGTPLATGAYYYSIDLANGTKPIKGMLTVLTR